MKQAMLRGVAILLSGGAVVQAAAPAAPAATDDATLFGSLEMATSAALSADGHKLVFVGSQPGTPGTLAIVLDLTKGSLTAVGRADGKPLNLTYCDWTANDRLVCGMRGVATYEKVHAPVTRMLAVDADGSHLLQLGEQDTDKQLGIRQFDGSIVDWMNGVDGQILMARTYVPEMNTARRAARAGLGLGVDRIDTRTGKVTAVERPDEQVGRYVSDGRGNIRVKTVRQTNAEGDLKGVNQYFYRKASDREWLPLGASQFLTAEKSDSMTPLAVDPIDNAAYVLKSRDGKQALFRIALDGSMNTEMTFGSAQGDVTGVIRLGRSGRVIGVTYFTDQQQVQYFDPDYQQIVKSVATALPQLPWVNFVSASADENTLLIRAASDSDPGHYLIYDRRTRKLADVLQARPGLLGRKLSAERMVNYTAADGTRIRAYLRLPPGVSEAKGLPAIVMPLGGNGNRDEWGFDWLAQFFAQRGFAVMQLAYRDNSGDAETWFEANGFAKWKVAVGDVCDAGRWLVAQGIADPAKLAVAGWSYGGYAALQANVLDANLFKAVIAIGPVTDLTLLKNDMRNYTVGNLVSDYIGTGAHLIEGSPVQNAATFKAPVLLFHGERDFSADVEQSKSMDRALHNAGKTSQLVTYPDVERSLRDAAARADLLRKSEAFLKEHLKL